MVPIFPSLLTLILISSQGVIQFLTWIITILPPCKLEAIHRKTFHNHKNILLLIKISLLGLASIHYTAWANLHCDGGKRLSTSKIPSTFTHEHSTLSKTTFSPHLLSVWARVFLFLARSIIHYCPSLFWYSHCPRFGQWELLLVSSCTLSTCPQLSFSSFWPLSYLLA